MTQDAPFPWGKPSYQTDVATYNHMKHNDIRIDRHHPR